MYTILWDKAALNDLKSLDKNKALIIIKKIESHLAQNPEKLGKTLTAEWKGLYRYRFGNYRVIYQIDAVDITIIVVKIGHKREIYHIK